MTMLSSVLMTAFMSCTFAPVIHYAFDPADVAMCRKRGYREEFGVMSGGRMSYVLCLDI